MLGLDSLAALAHLGPKVDAGLTAVPFVIDGPAEPDPSMLEGGSRSAPLQATPHVFSLSLEKSC